MTLQAKLSFSDARIQVMTAILFWQPSLMHTDPRAINHRRHHHRALLVALQCNGQRSQKRCCQGLSVDLDFTIFIEDIMNISILS